MFVVVSLCEMLTLSLQRNGFVTEHRKHAHLGHLSLMGLFPMLGNPATSVKFSVKCPNGCECNMKMHT